MDLPILKKKLDGFRLSNGSIRDVSAEVLWELRQAWENFTGPIDEFRTQVGVQTGTLRNLLASAKKLNHAMASSQNVGLHGEVEQVAGGSGGGSIPAQPGALELVYDRGETVIRFPSVDTLIDFLKKAA